ncbi:peptidase S8/S53 domain-containing protein [Lactifluus volemus]|nr:peptidase S8/S53 domain-containing protein [Lactifluus volemus]
MWLLFPLLFVLHSVWALRYSFRDYDYYVLELDPYVGSSLSQVAGRLGVQVVERAGELDNLWVVRAPKRHPSTSLGSRGETRDPIFSTLNALRTSLSARDPDAHIAHRMAASVKYLARQELRQRAKRAPPPIRPGNDSSKHPLAQAVVDRLDIQDPLFLQQWHLVNEEFPEHMMNVTRLWDMGITGAGVVTAIVDDGLDYDHEDLADNFWAPGSYDYNDHEDLPTPKLAEDHHGTRCAGQVAAVKNEPAVRGYPHPSGAITDVDEAAALNLKYQNTSIYSCSWGPPDDGKSMESPSYIIESAIVNGIKNGRGGRGSIYVFASGNGAAYGDQCNFDGYTNSIYSITVAAIDYKGLHPIYSESCAANLVVAYSSGSGNHIITTDKGQSACSTTHGGTSAAAPNAAGVFALALSVRPDLTWRDLQHLAVRTAEVVNIDDPDWDRTAVGRPFSYKYGYGRLNGYEFVMAAQKWETVKPQAWRRHIELNRRHGWGSPIVDGGITSTITITEEDLELNNFELLEHVTVRVWITHDRRGDVEVEITSPNGIKSILAARRRLDMDTDGFPAWRFMSVKHWDEDPRGDWTIRVSDIGAENRTGNFLGWQLSLFGSTIDSSIARDYELSTSVNVLPSIPSVNGPSTEQPSTTTKAHTKPTDHLPGNHGSAEGEASKPAFDDGSDSTKPFPTATASGSMVPTADEGWFSDMSTLVSNQKWVFGAAGIVILFGVLAGVFLCRRAVRRRRAAGDQYSALPGDDFALGTIQRGGRAPPRTKELYDAFGEYEEDDEDDVDENTGLRASSPSGGGGGLGFHEGFLDDENPNTPRMAPTQGHEAYHDEPERKEGPSSSRDPPSPSGSGSGSGSGDGSWEHASQTR